MALATFWKVAAALGLTGVVGAWIGGYLGTFLPPPPRLVRAIGHALGRLRGTHPPPADDGRYHLVLCALDGDADSRWTLIRFRVHRFVVLTTAFQNRKTCFGV